MIHLLLPNGRTGCGKIRNRLLTGGVNQFVQVTCIICKKSRAYKTLAKIKPAKKPYVEPRSRFMYK